MMNLKKSVFYGVFVSLALIGCQKQVNEQTKTDERTNTTKNQNIVTIGLDDTIPPLEFHNLEGELVGYDVDLAKETFSRLGKQVVFKPIDWAKKDDELFNKKIDMIWSGMFITEDRKKKFLFSNPYLKVTSIVAVKADSPINTKLDLAGKKVGYPNGYQIGEEVNEFAKQNNITINTVAVPEAALGLSQVLEGKLDAVTSDSYQIQFFVKNSPGKFKILDEKFKEYGVGIAFRLEDKDLQSQVNKTLAEIKNDGTEAKLTQKWFGSAENGE